MIASGKRNQERFHGEFHVLYVRQSRVSAEERNRISRFLDLAKEAGAQVQVLEADDSVAAILDYARRKRITQIFVGHSRRGDWLSRLWQNPLDRLLRDGETMDLRIFPQ